MPRVKPWQLSHGGVSLLLRGGPTRISSAIVDWVSGFGHWLGTVPAGIWGAVAGAVSARILTWLAERRRNRDAYRAPQREAIGAIIAAANDMKVSLSDAIEHMGLTGRQTTDDATVQSLNTFLRRLLGLDEQFSIGRLTVVDGPCRDKMLAAYVRYSDLRKLANQPDVATEAGFGTFIREMNDTSNDLDVFLAELVDLAEKRLSPARPLLGKRPKLKVASNKARPERKAVAAAHGQMREASTPERTEATDRNPTGGPAVEEREVEVAGEPDNVRIRRQVIKGAQLTAQHVGKLVAEAQGGYNVMGKILAITPTRSDPESWIVAVHWAGPPGQPARVERRRVRFSDDVELVEILPGETE